MGRNGGICKKLGRVHLYFSPLLWLQSKLVGMHRVQLWPLTAYQVSLNFFYISELIRQSDNSSVLILAIAGWPHFWETKFPEFSLRFPGHFKIFPWASQERKFDGMHFCWQSCHIFFIFPEFSRFLLQNIKIPWVSAEILTIFQIPWVFQVFHAFQVCGHPELWCHITFICISRWHPPHYKFLNFEWKYLENQKWYQKNHQLHSFFFYNVSDLSISHPRSTCFWGKLSL